MLVSVEMEAFLEQGLSSLTVGLSQIAFGQ